MALPDQGLPAGLARQRLAERERHVPAGPPLGRRDAADDGGFDASGAAVGPQAALLRRVQKSDRLASLNTSFADGRFTFYGADPVTVDPSTKKGRETIEDIIRRRVGAATRLVTGGESHQFGNTRSGVRHHGDTRTIHVVNAASVAAVRRATGLDVDAAVFRPNVVVEGLAPWAAVRKSTSELGYPGSLLFHTGGRRRTGSENDG